MLEYFIGLRASRLDDYGNVHDAQHIIRYTTRSIMRIDALVRMALDELRKHYPTSERWYNQQYSLDGSEWHNA